MDYNIKKCPFALLSPCLGDECMAYFTVDKTDTKIETVAIGVSDKGDCEYDGWTLTRDDAEKALMLYRVKTPGYGVKEGDVVRTDAKLIRVTKGKGQCRRLLHNGR